MKKTNTDTPLALTEHLEELRARIIKSLICVIVISCAVYAFSGKIISNLAKPVGKLVFIAPQEAFLANIKIAFFGGVFLASPFVVYHFWRFISVGLNRAEGKYVLLFCPLSFLLFVVGAVFGYYIIVPIGIKFLLGFATDSMAPMISVSKYISFVGMLTFAFGIVFQIPIISLFLTKIGLVTPQFLSEKRKYAVVGIFISSALFTPPDVVTQCLMAVPLFVLYEIGIILSRFVYKKKSGYQKQIDRKKWKR